MSQFIQVDAVYSMGHSSCKTPNKTKASPPQWGRGRGFVQTVYLQTLSGEKGEKKKGGKEKETKVQSYKHIWE